MDDLNKFVEVWEKTGNIEEVISQNLVLPAPHDVQVYLSGLAESEHQRIRKSLDAALSALASHTSRMEDEAVSLRAQIEQNIQASNACIVYNNVPRKPRS